jgi:hypothetical protein
VVAAALLSALPAGAATRPSAALVDYIRGVHKADQVMVLKPSAATNNKSLTMRVYGRPAPELGAEGLVVTAIDGREREAFHALVVRPRLALGEYLDGGRTKALGALKGQEFRVVQGGTFNNTIFQTGERGGRPFVAVSTYALLEATDPATAAWVKERWFR